MKIRRYLPMVLISAAMGLACARAPAAQEAGHTLIKPYPGSTLHSS